MSDALVAALQASGARFLAAARAVPEAHWATLPPSGGWSAGQVVEHVVMVEKRVAAALHGAEEQVGAPADAYTGSDEDIRAFLMDRTVHPPAPGPTIPPAEPDEREALLTAFEEAHAGLIHLQHTHGAHLAHRFVKHGRFGLVDGRRWLVLLAAHAERHALQIDEVVAAVA